VSADQALLEALSDGRNKDKAEILAMEFMKRDAVLKVLMEKMQAWYEIRVEGKDTVVKFVFHFFFSILHLTSFIHLLGKAS
jgi:translation initiation factor 2D